MNRISLIALGVKDIAKSFKFYHDGLGFVTDEKMDDLKTIFFNTLGTKFELCPLDSLAEDISKTNPPKIAGGFAGITLVYNVRTEWEVDQTTELARNAGAVIVKEPEKAAWGGYHAYFQDKDGYYWEIAHNPYWSLDENSMLVF
ncbi:MAG: VOC family protein [Treponema sp.]|jgi:catechol 2,3-dioxygenase-like lactoylglutathione lyase family enzyme|nr:VOC family protein [Treponema sp.]